MQFSDFSGKWWVTSTQQLRRVFEKSTFSFLLNEKFTTICFELDSDIPCTQKVWSALFRFSEDRSLSPPSFTPYRWLRKISFRLQSLMKIAGRKLARCLLILFISNLSFILYLQYSMVRVMTVHFGLIKSISLLFIVLQIWFFSLNVM